MAKVSEDPPSPVDAYESPANATPVGDPVQPQYYQAPPVAAAKRPFDDWSVLAIVALIASCIGFTVPGIVMGHIALHKIKQTGQAERGFAVAALIVGYVLFVLIVAAVIAWVLFLVFTLSIANSAASLGGDFG